MTFKWWSVLILILLLFYKGQISATVGLSGENKQLKHPFTETKCVKQGKRLSHFYKITLLIPRREVEKNEKYKIKKLAKYMYILYKKKGGRVFKKYC